jgi:hypothetical protein
MELSDKYHSGCNFCSDKRIESGSANKRKEEATAGAKREVADGETKEARDGEGAAVFGFKA